MLSRRLFISSSAAVLGLAAMPAWARRNYEVPTKHLPVVVKIQDSIAPGEIHVDPNRFYLYWTLPEGQAIRYVVGVGRPGLYEQGTFTVGAKKVWPSWKPTDDMIERTRLCLSCHYGTTEQFVTHEIMGAGHPRISSTETRSCTISPWGTMMRSGNG